MGANESSSNKNSVSRTELERALERQRVYHNAVLMQEQLARAAQVQEARHATREEIERALKEKEKLHKIELEKQKKIAQQEAANRARAEAEKNRAAAAEARARAEAQRMRDEAEKVRAAATTAVAALASTQMSPIPSAPTETTSIERQRSPYSLCQDEARTLNNRTSTNMYPSLATEYAKLNLRDNPTEAAASSPHGVGNISPRPSAPPRTDFCAPNDNTSSTAPSIKPHPKSEYNCPTCGAMFGAHIYTCASGHSACAACRASGAICALCRAHITDIRNIALSALMAELVLPCSNANSGCSLHFKQVDMENHLKECPFSCLPCPVSVIFGNCSWKGKSAQLRQHFDKQHAEFRQSTVDQEMCLPDITRENHVLHLVQLGIHNFLVHVLVSPANQMLYMTVQMVGTAFSAAKWTYEFNIYKKSQPRRKYEFSDACHGNGLSYKEIIQDGKCACLPISYAKTFLTGQGLNYKFYIKNDMKPGIEKNGDNNIKRGGRGQGGEHSRTRARTWRQRDRSACSDY